MAGKRDRQQTVTPHGGLRKAVGSRREPELLKNPVKEADAELQLALERWEDEGGGFDYRSIVSPCVRV